MPARKRGPKPTLRKAVRISVLLEGSQVRRLDAFARLYRMNRSEALRKLVEDSLEVQAGWRPAPEK